ncbi:sensor histidine kinase [Echinimonas agarilytica]|uniref:histidine kinase n=1 Tax=Echinimonas agarilytica TaxID=1215918 RepID=A0AA42B896_9GAMM|nr:ATP-binding protein [Echinimonas agarilytica]
MAIFQYYQNRADVLGRIMRAQSFASPIIEELAQNGNVEMLEDLLIRLSQADDISYMAIVLDSQQVIASAHISNTNLPPLPNRIDGPYYIKNNHGHFGFVFPLQQFKGYESSQVKWVIFSDNNVLLAQTQITWLVIFLSSLVTALSVAVISKSVLNNSLKKPLLDLNRQLNLIDFNTPEHRQLKWHPHFRQELKAWVDNVNVLLNRLSVEQQDLSIAKSKMAKLNKELNRSNHQLLDEVNRKTAHLQKALTELEEQKIELEANHDALLSEIGQREETENILKLQRCALQKTVADLEATQNQLVESAKFASLGELVAGVAHEINTPVGVTVTALSFLTERLDTLNTEFRDGTLTQGGMEQILTDCSQSCDLMTSNLHRAAKLISSFKQVAVDQSSESVRQVQLSSYIKDVVTSLQPELKRGQHTVNISCAGDLYLTTRTGALSQVITNLVMNSVIHGFEEKAKGVIEISIQQEQGQIEITYSDNGKGMNDDSLKRLFDPFFTTRRGKGGSGLGAHLVYNLVTHSMKGAIIANSQEGMGLTYTIQLPQLSVDQKSAE